MNATATRKREGKTDTAVGNAQARECERPNRPCIQPARLDANSNGEATDVIKFVKNPVPMWV